MKPGIKSITLLFVLFLLGFGATSAFKMYQGSQAVQVMNKNDGVFLSAIAVVSSQCAICNDSRIVMGIQRAFDTVRTIASELGTESNVTVISVDATIDAGLEYVHKFDNIDEIIVGNNWRNSGAFKHIWASDLVQASTPQVLVLIEDIELTASNGLIARLDKQEDLLHRASSAESILALPELLLSNEFRRSVLSSIDVLRN